MSKQKIKSDFKAKIMAEPCRNEEYFWWKFPPQKLKWF